MTCFAVDSRSTGTVPGTRPATTATVSTPAPSPTRASSRPSARWRIAWSTVTVRPALRAPREPPVQRVGLFFKFCLELFERFLFVFVLKESWFLIVFHQSQVSYSEWQSKPSFFFLDSSYYLQIFFFYLEKTNRKYLLKIIENNKKHT